MRYVKDIRKKRRLSQTQLADMVGCDQSMISKIEAGTANPTLDLIEGIAVAPCSSGESELSRVIVRPLESDKLND
jgi:transcriptional regulator with XRE-family HTH domain